MAARASCAALRRAWRRVTRHRAVGSGVASVACLAGMLRAVPARAQELGERVLIAGDVRTAQQVPVVGIVVRVIGGGARIVATTTTDSVGRFRALVRVDEGRVVVQVNVIGFAPTSEPVTLTAVTGSSFIRVVLAESAVALIAMRVQAERPRPDRSTANSPVPRSSRRLDRSSAVLNDASGDVGSSLAQIPGITAVDLGDGRLGGTAFGLTADQNGATLNGLETGVGFLPRDGLQQTVRLSTYDPRNGRFGGFQLSSVLPSGSPITLRTLRVTAAPATVGRDIGTTGGRLSPPPLVVSGTMFGPLRGRHQFYSASSQVQQSRLPVIDLGTRSAASLPADSVQAIFVAAQRLGVATSPERFPSQQLTTSTGLVRVDLTPYASGADAESGPVAYVLAAVNDRRGGAQGLTPWSARSRAGASGEADAQVAAVFSPYFRAVLNETKVSLGRNRTRFIPSIAAPGVAVRIGADQADTSSRGGVAFLGGGRQLATRDVQSRQMTTDWQWMTFSGRHRFNVYADALSRRYRTETAANALGTWEYESVNAFEQNQPARFSRDVSVARRDGGLTQLAFAVSDLIFLSDSARFDPSANGNGITVQGGLRLDMNHYARPSHFGTVDARLPNSLSLQPMLGVTWRQGQYQMRSGGGSLSDSRHTVVGGVRRYRGVPSLQAGDEILPEGAATERALDCVGVEVPVPDWLALAGGAPAPTRCAVAGNGVGAGPLTRSRRYADGFQPSDSWRAEVQWTGVLTGVVELNAGVTQAWNTRLRSMIDQNLVDDPKFTLAQDGRPVFVDAAAIDPATASIVLLASRRDVTRGRSDIIVSDLSSRALVATVGMTLRTTPERMRSDSRTPPLNATLRSWYSYTDARGSQRGFGASTAGDPRLVDPKIAMQPAHAVQTVLEVSRQGWFMMGVAVRVTSGAPYTPMIGRDVNGDGLTNDRAFIPREDSPTFGVFNAQVAGLPRDARRCLDAQRGRIAAAASCRTRPSVELGNLNLTLDPYRLGFGRRGSISLTVQNALGGVDALLHGEKRRKGWGDRPYADQVLLVPRSFNAGTRAFAYDVNAGFGSSGSLRALLRPPVVVMLDARFDLSRNFEGQALKLRLQDNEGASGTGPMTFDWLWEEAKRSPIWEWTDAPGLLDSLHLDRTTAATVADVVTRTNAERRALYTSLSITFAALPTQTLTAEARRRWHATIVESAEVTYRANRHIASLLTNEQRDWLRTHGLAGGIDLRNEWLRKMRKDWHTRPL